MASLDWQCQRADGVTFVEVLVTSDTPKRVRIESTIEPVWPPRSQGRPIAGWEDTTFEGIVSGASALAVGYASPAEPAEPPAIIVETTSAERADDAGTQTAPDGSVRAETEQCESLNAAETGTTDTNRDIDRPSSQNGTEEVTPRALVRTLGESGPPRDVVPLPNDNGAKQHDTRGGSPGDETQQKGHANDQSPSVEMPGENTTNGRLPSDEPVDTRATNGQSPTQRGLQEQRRSSVNATFDRTAEKQTDQMECPALSWFETVERRLDRAEQLASVETVEQARAAVDAAGGIDAARELAATIRTDRETLTQLEQRRSEVSDRIEHVEIPLDTLEQIT